MAFRPCIDIHQGVVKQIVGSTLSDEAQKTTTEQPVENFVATKSAADYALMYRNDNLRGRKLVLFSLAKHVRAYITTYSLIHVYTYLTT